MIVWVHFIAALSVLVLGGINLAAAKGTAPAQGDGLGVDRRNAAGDGSVLLDPGDAAGRP